MSGIVPNNVQQEGLPLTGNSSTTPLTNGQTFTGVGVDVSGYGSVVSAAYSDMAGVMYMEFSSDNSNWDSSLTFSVAASTNEVHRLSVTRKYFRVRFTNNSGGNQTIFRLQTLVGSQPPITSTLNSVVQSDADAILVRPTDYTVDVAKEKITGSTNFGKFGKNGSVGTSPTVIATTGDYKTPTALTSLEVLSSSANDTSAGTGARQVTVIGIGANFQEVTQVVTMNGVTPVALSTQLYRLYRWYVSEAGTYGAISGGSNVGTLTIRVAGAGATWDTIGLLNSLGKGQSQIACYTVPASKRLYVYSVDFSVDTSKSVNLYLFIRDRADDFTVPYSGIRIRREYDGVTGFGRIDLKFPLVFDEKTDLGWLGNTSTGTASVSIQMDGVLIDV